MADETNLHTQDSDALLNRADTLLGRHKITAPVLEVPVLTEVASADLTDNIPTLTDIVVSLSSPTAAAKISPPPSSLPAGQNLEYAVYRKLKQKFDQEIAAGVRPAPEAAAALDQTLRKISSELKADIDAMVRTSVAEALRARNGKETPVPVRTASDIPTPKK